ncbi:MAG: hypothetical protein ABW122_00945 [Ilumatobacteraceae bacterium]
MSASIGRPTDTAMWASVAATLRRTVLPAVDDPHTRQVVIQLIGLATYARDRGEDPTALRVAALAQALDQLAAAGNPVVVDRWPVGNGRDADVVMAVCAEVLVHAADADEGSREAVRTGVRALLVEQLDADLVSEDVLLGAFRGRLPDER